MGRIIYMNVNPVIKKNRGAGFGKSRDGTMEDRK